MILRFSDAYIIKSSDFYLLRCLGLGFLDAQMIRFSDPTAAYPAVEMHSCCSGRILCCREVTYAVYAAYAAYGWGSRAEVICPGDGKVKCLGPTKQTTREPESHLSRQQESREQPQQTTRDKRQHMNLSRQEERCTSLHSLGPHKGAGG